MEESGIFKKAQHQCELEIMAAAHTVYLRQVREKGRRVLGPEHDTAHSRECLSGARRRGSGLCLQQAVGQIPHAV